MLLRLLGSPRRGLCRSRPMRALSKAASSFISRVVSHDTDTPTVMHTDEDESLVAVIRRHAETIPQHRVFTWVDGSCQEVDKLTYSEVWAYSGAVADLLKRQGCVPGDRVMIAYPFGLAFVPALVGCFRSGIVACSVYPPNPRQLASDIPKFEGFAHDAGAKLALTTNAFMWLMRASSLVNRMSVKWVATDLLRAAPPVVAADHRRVGEARCLYRSRRPAARGGPGGHRHPREHDRVQVGRVARVPRAVVHSRSAPAIRGIALVGEPWV